MKVEVNKNFTGLFFLSSLAALAPVELQSGPRRECLARFKNLSRVFGPFWQFKKDVYVKHVY